MVVQSVASLGTALRTLRLLDASQLGELPALETRFQEPAAFAKELLRRGWLTAWQANLLLQGRGEELVLGAYVFLDRLGAGGMGQVFKARHRTLGRIAAVKLIHKDRLTHADAVRRFQREVRAAAALSHPNIVLAYDADEIAGAHLLVMECVDGANDLAKLVKTTGPLPPLLACEYLRQTALALQHAHERGMVHRDIKPANLLLTADGRTIKILDMGLARLDQRPTDDIEKSSTMTQEGALMGTPDFMAPEQATDSHSVDIRADIYSLGCTGYFLLTGQPPFQGASLLEKLMQHRLEEPTPLEQIQTPAPVAATIRKMMAKRPEDRYQSPADAAAALTAAIGGSDPFARMPVPRRSSKEAAPDALVAAFGFMAERNERAVPATGITRRILTVALLGGIVLAVAIGVIASGIFKTAGSGKTTPDADLSFEAWMKKVAVMPPTKQVEAVSARLRALNPGFNGWLAHNADNRAVTEVAINSSKVKDISPLRALTELTAVDCSDTRVTDLTPLKNRQLKQFNCASTPVADLSVLRGMPLRHLRCTGTPVSDLTPVRDCPLVEISCDFVHERDAPVMRSISTLTLINGKKAADFWSEADGEEQIRKVMTRLKELNPKMNNKVFGKKIENGKVTALAFIGAFVNDLSPIRELDGLQELNLGVQFGHESKLNLTALQGLPLTRLDLYNTRARDLSPLKGMPLTYLDCRICYLQDHEFLRELPVLRVVNLDYVPARDAQVLRSLKTLKTINGAAAAEVLGSQ